MIEDTPIDAIAERNRLERIELTRIAAQRIVDNDAKGVGTADRHSRNWARQFVALNKPLAGPLGTGEPA